MASWGNRVVAEVVTRLRAAAPPGVKVLRFPTRDGSGTQIGVYGLERATEPSGRSASLVFHRHRIAVEIREAGVESDGETSPGPDELVDELYVLTIQTLMEDPTLGGLIRTLEEKKSSWKAAPGEKVTGVLQLDLEAIYQTRADNPEERT